MVTGVPRPAPGTRPIAVSPPRGPEDDRPRPHSRVLSVRPLLGPDFSPHGIGTLRLGVVDLDVNSSSGAGGGFAARRRGLQLLGASCGSTACAVAAAIPSSSSVPLARMRNSSTPICEMSRLTLLDLLGGQVLLAAARIHRRVGRMISKRRVAQRADGDVLDVGGVDPPLDLCGELIHLLGWTAPSRRRRLRGLSGLLAGLVFRSAVPLQVDLVDENRSAREVDARAGTCPVGQACTTAPPGGTGSGKSTTRGDSSVAWC